MLRLNKLSYPNLINFVKREATTHGYTHEEIAKMATSMKRRRDVPVQTVDSAAKALGFNTPEEMYPEYPLKEPPKLWLIKQIKELKYRPWWEKDIMKFMGLYRLDDLTVQMNTEEINDKLWQVKHLIRISPIMFPQGFPTEADIGHTLMKHNGTFLIKNKIKENELSDEDKIPEPAIEDFKVVDGYRMCYNCRHKSCLQWNMCKKLREQRRPNNIEYIGPKMFKYIDHPSKRKSVQN